MFDKLDFMLNALWWTGFMCGVSFALSLVLLLALMRMRSNSRPSKG